MAEMTFTTDDCIKLRKLVLRFYENCSPAGRHANNIIDAEQPEMDVASDFQMLCYCYLLMAANREMEEAEKIMIGGKPVIRQGAKQMLGRYKRAFQTIRTYMPMNDTVFVSDWAETDDIINECVDGIIQKTYWPLLNNSRKETPDAPAEVAQCVAHIITAMAFAVMAVERGMEDNHRVQSPAFHHFGDHIIRVAAAVVQVNGTQVEFNDDTLRDILTQSLTVVQNGLQPLMQAVIDRAQAIDLEPYVASADCTLERFRAMIEKQKKQQTRQIARV